MSYPSTRDQLAAVYRRDGRALLALAGSVTGHPQDAEDAVHDAFTRLAARPTLPADNPRAFVFRCVRNAAIDRRRRRGREARRASELLATLFRDAENAGPGGNGDPSAGLIDREQRQRLMEALAELPDEDREVLILRDLAGMSLAEAARTLGCPRTTAGSRYQRALERLRCDATLEAVR